MKPISLTFVLLLACPALASTLVPSSECLLEEIAASDSGASNPSITEISYALALETLSKGDLISVGESHESGLERAIIAKLYSDLSPKLDKIQKCLVEDYPLLIEKPAQTRDPVQAAMNSVCPKNIVFSNPTFNYEKPLKQALEGLFGKPRKVFTHTGMRHVLPMGLLYPLDFPKNFPPSDPLDLKPKGSITTQVPASFIRNSRTMRSHLPLALDNLVVQMIRHEVDEWAVHSTSARDIATKLRDLDTRIARTLSSAPLQFPSSENVKVFELQRVQQSFQYHRSFASLINHKLLTSEIVHSLLTAPELEKFFSVVKPSTVQVLYFRGEKGGAMDVGYKVFSGPAFLALLGKVPSDPSNSETETLLLIHTDKNRPIAILETP